MSCSASFVLAKRRFNRSRQRIRRWCKSQGLTLGQLVGRHRHNAVVTEFLESKRSLAVAHSLAAQRHSKLASVLSRKDPSFPASDMRAYHRRFSPKGSGREIVWKEILPDGADPPVEPTTAVKVDSDTVECQTDDISLFDQINSAFSRDLLSTEDFTAQITTRDGLDNGHEDGEPFFMFGLTLQGKRLFSRTVPGDTIVFLRNLIGLVIASELAVDRLFQYTRVAKKTLKKDDVKEILNVGVEIQRKVKFFRPFVDLGDRTEGSSAGITLNL